MAIGRIPFSHPDGWPEFASHPPGGEADLHHLRAFSPRYESRTQGWRSVAVADVVVREAEAVADGDNPDHDLVDRRDLMRLAKVCGLGPPIARYT